VSAPTALRSRGRAGTEQSDLVSDRDDGRPRDIPRARRNTRPRDALGRPLPYGSAGVAGPPEGVVRTPADTLAEGQRLLDGGRPFHAHEVFEDAWKAAPEPERELWRGLAQLAVGCTHAARGNPSGAVALLRRGAVAIAPWRGSRPHGLDVDGLLAWVEVAVAEVAAGRPVPAPSLVAG
jgi:uncharacterized protein